MAINDVFSKRNNPLPDVYEYDALPDRFRIQIKLLMKEVYDQHTGAQDGISEFVAIRNIACREHGRNHLHESAGGEVSDILGCIEKSPNVPLVLDVIEAGCRLIQRSLPYRFEPAPFLAEINHRFRENGLGYEFNVAARQLIRVDNQLVHQSAIQPALHLLANPRFKTANEEFLEAFDDYRKADYDDCLTKCCAAFESVMKIVCDLKGWPFKTSDTASTLIKTNLANNGLDSFFDGPLTIIATLRNKLSKSHGAGTQVKHVPAHLARYALNATASAILLIVDAATLS